MNKDLLEALRALKIEDKKIDEITNKKQILSNLEMIFQKTTEFTRIHYSLGCTAPRGIDIIKATEIVDNGVVKQDNLLRCLYKAMEMHKSKEECINFIKENDKPKEEIEKEVKKLLGKPKKDILREMKNKMPYADFKVVMEILNEVEDVEGEEDTTKHDWLSEGEITKLPAPKDMNQRSDKIKEEHLSRTGGRVVTRFPPEPNGSLHIGHAKALNLSFCYAKKYDGWTYLRYDDTNPKNEDQVHFESILEDVKWLGFEPKAITHSSDYFEKMKEFSFELIKKRKGYVCHCKNEDIGNRRKQFQTERDAGAVDPTILSPYRNRSVEENLIEFQKMLEGKYRDGEAVFRFRMELESKNPLMLDLVGSRIINMKHPYKDVNYIVYPSYEFALCVADSLEDVTHSFCSREFYTRQEPYHWLLRNLGLYEPMQWEFSRLNLSNTVLSKRKLASIVKGGMEWDDPRLYTIKGMRRRGFTPKAINSFVRSVGITFSETVVDVKILENFVRNDLNQTSIRVFCVKNPIKITINNMDKIKVSLPISNGTETFGTEEVSVNRVVYIESGDFSESPDSSFLRFTRDNPVGLMHIGAIRFIEMTTDGIVAEKVDTVPRKFIHWIPNLNNKVTLRLYEPLFNSFDPEKQGYMEDLNPNSLTVVKAYCCPRAMNAVTLDKLQFVRQGYFCCDKDSKIGDLIFNLTLPLKNVN